MTNEKIWVAETIQAATRNGARQTATGLRFGEERVYTVRQVEGGALDGLKFSEWRLLGAVGLPLHVEDTLNRVVEKFAPRDSCDEEPEIAEGEVGGGDPVGRYDGDLLAELDHDPTAGRKPFRVRVWVWRRPGMWRRDEPTPPFEWYAARDLSITGEPAHLKEFRRLEGALNYLFSIRARAEYPIAAEKVRSSAESRREVLA